MHRTTMLTAFLCSFALTCWNVANAEEHVWLFAGQSNMTGGKGMYEAALRPVVEEAGYEFTPLHLAWGGNKIENWLDPSEKDYPRNWGETEKALQAAVQRGATIAGVQWFQGESNVGRNASVYEDQLNELIARLRRVAKTPKLPVLVVQLGPGTYAETQGEWSLGILREAQRRVAHADQNVALVAATDCKLQDRVVHLGRTNDSHGIVAQRLADAAKKLVYGKPETGIGPQVVGAKFGNAERNVVVVQFDGVTGSLDLHPEALGQFFASTKLTLPKQLSEAPHPREFGEQSTDHITPIGFTLVGNAVALRFAEPLPASAVISWTATGHAALGRGRRWEVVFARLTDESGHQAPAFAALPIAPFEGKPVAVAERSTVRSTSKGDRPVAVNLFLSPGGVLEQDEIAGYGEWRQSNWNSTARFTFPHLFDDHGHITDIAAYSYIHFGKRGKLQDANADQRLRFSGQTQHAEFRHLEVDTEYDVVLYIVAAGEKPESWANLSVAHWLPPKKSGSKSGEVVVWEQRVFGATADADRHGWQLAQKSSEWRGNVAIVTKVNSGPLGVIRCKIAAPPKHRADVPNPAIKPYICGMQIRKSK